MSRDDTYIRPNILAPSGKRKNSLVRDPDMIDRVQLPKAHLAHLRLRLNRILETPIRLD